MSFVNYYHLLDFSLGPSSSLPAIRRFYRSRALSLHPDKNPDPNASSLFQAVRLAYEILSDPVKRSSFDNELLRRTQEQRLEQAERQGREEKQKDQQEKIRMFRSKLESDEQAAHEAAVSAAPGKSTKRGLSLENEGILQRLRKRSHTSIQAFPSSSSSSSLSSSFSPTFSVVISSFTPVLPDFIHFRLFENVKKTHEKWKNHGKNQFVYEFQVETQNAALIANRLSELTDVIGHSTGFGVIEGEQISQLKDRIKRRIKKHQKNTEK
jgi:curved DNA-binding protein CbpA